MEEDKEEDRKEGGEGLFKPQCLMCAFCQRYKDSSTFPMEFKNMKIGDKESMIFHQESEPGKWWPVVVTQKNKKQPVKYLYFKGDISELKISKNNVDDKIYFIEKERRSSPRLQ